MTPKSHKNTELISYIWYTESVREIRKVFININHLPTFREDNVNEVFVDMGRFVGDTLEGYLFTKVVTFKKYYIFEPDEKNYNALLKRIHRLNQE